ncbi:small ribosomal subunit protein uS11m-like [Saccoglossus kowalevskii]|uniref:28S ribosomal protein S11, mitochondrial-like n=1 Tax=Saccoglossus kowalevskii TaxID=10224 RepID=A0ABM0GYH2_SACKO|nr:PREDICTED: 28S ribosomal protein S11, mitochondrial-like [Saccoglossus kowalevskii]
MATSAVSLIRRGCHILCRQILVNQLRIPVVALQPQTTAFLCMSSRQFQEDVSVKTEEASPETETEQDLSISHTYQRPTDNLIFGGIAFKDLPIVHIKSTYNNTHFHVTDCSYKSLVRTSCGTEGFKNARKATGVAAQTAGIAAAAKAIDKGVKYVRVVIKGLGPGRQSSIKGLQMGGLDIISITDNTPVPNNGCRPRKARRL